MRSRLPSGSVSTGADSSDSTSSSIADQEIELLPGVRETLADLASRHRVILMTKGNEVEQVCARSAHDLDVALGQPAGERRQIGTVGREGVR